MEFFAFLFLLIFCFQCSREGGQILRPGSETATSNSSDLKAFVINEGDLKAYGSSVQVSQFQSREEIQKIRIGMAGSTSVDWQDMKDSFQLAVSSSGLQTVVAQFQRQDSIQSKRFRQSILMHVEQSPVVANLFARMKLGRQHACFEAENHLTCWGSNQAGESGQDAAQSLLSTPTQVVGVEKIKQIALSDYVTLVLKQDGSLWSWGSNFWGQLGDGSDRSVKRHEPQQVAHSEKILQVVAGQGHACFLNQSQKVFCWGQNQKYQAGPSASDLLFVPTEVSLPLQTVQIYAGGENTCALGLDQRIMCWGGNDFGQLGRSSSQTPQEHAPFKAKGPLDLALANGTICALLLDGSLACVGANHAGQLGTGSTSPRKSSKSYVIPHLGEKAIALEGSQNHFCALLESGGLFCWGANESYCNTKLPVNAILSPQRIFFSQQQDAETFLLGPHLQCLVKYSKTSYVKCWGENKFGVLGETPSEIVLTLQDL